MVALPLKELFLELLVLKLKIHISFSKCHHMQKAVSKGPSASNQRGGFCTVFSVWKPIAAFSDPDSRNEWFCISIGHIVTWPETAERFGRNLL